MADQDQDSSTAPAADPNPAPATDATSPDIRPSPAAEFEQIVTKALRYIKAKRGGDLAAILLVGSAVRDALLPHSDVNLVVLVRGTENRHELVRIQDRIVEIRYLGLVSLEEQMKLSVRWPATLRKARILFEFEAEGSHLLEQAHGRFRQGTPPLNLHEKIRIRHDALHWLGKAEDQATDGAVARYLLSIYLDECINAFYYLRGFWLGPQSDSLRFISQRDPVLGDLLRRALTAPDWTEQLALGRQVAQHLFKDIPAVARID